jgi:hypothetical protein
MFSFADARAASAPSGGRAPGLLRWVCTSNPFYVLSAGLFLAGLYASFGAQAHQADTWALMAGLASYTVLLAATACLLVRFGNVWDDVRTVLLLVVLMFLATSVTFDELLVLDPPQGIICSLAGLVFAVVVSESVLHGARLGLPALFRGPYYLVLALFFLYPLALSPLAGGADSETLPWGLFGFCCAGGLVFLTLVPAIRAGAALVRDNGSPWRWPLYPWALFAVLGLAVPARGFLLCWSMHLPGVSAQDQVIFGPYFIVPFGLAVAVLLLEAGLVSRRRGVLGVALAAPGALAVLATLGHRNEGIYRDFLQTFTAELGGDPLYLSLLAAVAFYAYAMYRRVSLAAEGLTAALVAVAVLGPEALERGVEWPAWPVPILAAGVLQLGLGLEWRCAWRCLAGGGLAASAVVLALPAPVQGPAAFHLGLLIVLAVGAVFHTPLGRVLRGIGAGLVPLACVAALAGWLDGVAEVPAWAREVYPLALVGLLAVYGLRLRHRLSLGVGAVLLASWLGMAGWRGYAWLRQLVTGLDQITLGLAVFGLAVLTSLGKSGLLSRLVLAWWRRRPRSTPLPE